MNRIEFMTRLAALLQDIPVIERQEAMKYYNDYFDDAGVENEQSVIEELESPEKIAATIKADLKINNGQENQGEYRETGYTDTRFEEKKVPADEVYRQTANQEPPKTNSALKILLIVAIILVGAPIILPFGLAILAVVFACIVTIAAFFFAIIIAFIAIAVAGVVLFCAGIATLLPEFAVGLALIGSGLILGVIGIVGIVAGVKLCIVALPGIFRGIVWLCRKPFQRKAVA